MATQYLPPLATVKAQVNVLSRPAVTQFLNQACIIDEGDSTIALNQYVYIDSINTATTTYGVATTSTLYQKLTAWFNLNNSFGVSVYQAGPPTVVTPVSPASITSGTNIGLLTAFQAVTDGSLIVSFNGVSQTILGLDFSTTTSLTEVLGLLTQALTTAYPSVQFNGTSGANFIINAQNTNNSIQTTVSYFSTASTGTDVSGAGFFDFITGDATLTQGVAYTENPTTQITAFTAYLASQNAPTGGQTNVPFLTLLPYSWLTTSLTTLLTPYNTDTLSVYFMIDCIGYSFLSSSIYTAIQNFKSIIVIENGTATPTATNASYTFAFYMANYNATSTNSSNKSIRMSIIPGAIPDFSLTEPQQQNLLTAAINFFAGDSTSAFLQNGTNLGNASVVSNQGTPTTVFGASWNFWYGVARLYTEETRAVQGMVNGNGGIKYDSVGIIKLAAVQRATLGLLTRLGIVNRSIRNVINFIPYSKYAADYPADIVSGTYNGFSGTAVIAGYLIFLTLKYTITQG